VAARGSLAARASKSRGGVLNEVLLHGSIAIIDYDISYDMKVSRYIDHETMERHHLDMPLTSSLTS
jgi:hypothetical protein